MGTVIRVALPNKGRLAEDARRLFERAGLCAEFRDGRALVASLGEGFEALLVRAQDIPEFVADGAADVGVTGLDLVVESERRVRELLDLGFGRCRLVVAVTEESGIDAVTRIAPGTRVATPFPRSARRYFEALGIPVEIAALSGAAEVAPHLGVAEVIVDLTSTGSTLRVNGLREVTTIMESSARLVANEDAWCDPARQAAIAELRAALESVLRAESKRYLMANVPRDALAQVKQIIPGISGPTIVDVLDGGTMVAAHAVVDAPDVYRTIARLKEIGAEGILVTRIERLLP
ncbi:MAG TPA: ATP phosphoribosyltransferase [Gemmatimonadaceae bacterium]|nr:ATP phosphoribosyltransferase [Gemmatimonadaceae bacterium]